MDSTAGKAFTMSCPRHGLAFVHQHLAAVLTVLLSNAAVKKLNPGGTVLASITSCHQHVLTFFARRVKEARLSGQLLIIEGAEAHFIRNCNGLFSSLQVHESQHHHDAQHAHHLPSPLCR